MRCILICLTSGVTSDLKSGPEHNGKQEQINNDISMCEKYGLLCLGAHAQARYAVVFFRQIKDYALHLKLYFF